MSHTSSRLRFGHLPVALCTLSFALPSTPVFPEFLYHSFSLVFYRSPFLTRLSLFRSCSSPFSFTYFSWQSNCVAYFYLFNVVSGNISYFILFYCIVNLKLNQIMHVIVVNYHVHFSFNACDSCELSREFFSKKKNCENASDSCELAREFYASGCDDWYILIHFHALLY
jgi:hypothetical protein